MPQIRSNELDEFHREDHVQAHIHSLPTYLLYTSYPKPYLLPVNTLPYSDLKTILCHMLPNHLLYTTHFTPTPYLHTSIIPSTTHLGVK